MVDKLSREPQREQYNLQVLAMDFGYPSLSSNTTVKIIVPVNKPVTVAPTNAFHVSEGVDIGTQVGTVNASDPDMTQDSDHSLTYILKNPSGRYRIWNEQILFLLKPNSKLCFLILYVFLELLSISWEKDEPCARNKIQNLITSLTQTHLSTHIYCMGRNIN